MNRCTQQFCNKRTLTLYCDKHREERRAYLIEWYQNKLNFTLEQATELVQQIK